MKPDLVVVPHQIDTAEIMIDVSRDKRQIKKIETSELIDTYQTPPSKHDW